MCVEAGVSVLGDWLKPWLYSSGCDEGAIASAACSWYGSEKGPFPATRNR